MIRKTFLPFSRPSLDEEEINEVVRTLRSGWITTGPKTIEFENKFKEYVGSKYAIAVSSGTAALHLSLMVLDVEAGDEIITTPMTFASTVNMIVLQGLKPVFVDIDRDTLNIDPERIEERTGQRSKVILPVHFAGRPCNMDKILKIAEKYRLTVIEDAAHAIGARYKDSLIGTIGDLTAFSFHPNKNITTCEGGMITTNDDTYAEKLSLLRFHGLDKDAWKRYRQDGLPLYDINFLGYKYNLTDLQSSIGLHQLKKLEYFNRRRQELAEMYNDQFDDLKGIILPSTQYKDIKHAWHIYTIILDLDRLRINRQRFIDELKAANIGTSIHYTAVHLFSYYKNMFGFQNGDFPNAEFVSDRVVTLPLFPQMTQRDVKYVTAKVKEIVNKGLN